MYVCMYVCMYVSRSRASRSGRFKFRKLGSLQDSQALFGLFFAVGAASVGAASF